MELEPGRSIERYEVVGPLGAGGMASVARVRHRELGVDFALKLLHVDDPRVRERLLIEGRVQASLRHPNVLSVIDVFPVDGQPALVLEFVDGPSLDKHLRDRAPLPLSEVQALGAGIIRGMRAAHRAGCLHRDLKPANILLARDDEGWVPKVADFGLAKSGEHDSGATRTGQVMGTPAYMSPEQARDTKGVDARSDVFSLGCVLYELATGRRAFDGASMLVTLARIAAGSYAAPQTIRPDLPDEMVAAIRGALVVDPERRIPSCDVLLAVWRGEQTFEVSAAAELSMPTFFADVVGASPSESTWYPDAAGDPAANASAAPADSTLPGKPPPRAPDGPSQARFPSRWGPAAVGTLLVALVALWWARPDASAVDEPGAATGSVVEPVSAAPATDGEPRGLVDAVAAWSKGGARSVGVVAVAAIAVDPNEAGALSFHLMSTLEGALGDRVIAMPDAPWDAEGRRLAVDRARDAGLTHALRAALGQIGNTRSLNLELIDVAEPSSIQRVYRVAPTPDDLAQNAEANLASLFSGMAEDQAAREASRMVKEAIRHYGGQLKYCYEQALKRDPQIAGRVEVRWTVGDGGRVSGVSLGEGGITDTDLRDCIARKVERWMFPASVEGDIAWPFVFATQDLGGPAVE